jgi:glucose-6-phosphate isomerase
LELETNGVIVLLIEGGAKMDLSYNLGELRSAVDSALTRMGRERTIKRIWAKDHTAWKPEPTEIANRLGWLSIAAHLKTRVGLLQGFAGEVRGAGYTHALLLGMGGSSLAPAVFRQTFGAGDRNLDLAVLDSTHPDAVRAPLERLNPAKTLFIVSTKSGGTVETVSLFKTFFNHVQAKLGPERAGDHFACITDQGSGLQKMALENDFRMIFLNDPEIGGRYSALSYFGLMPAALVGVDLDRLLDRALTAMDECGAEVPAKDNPGAVLGAVMAEAARAGRDKLTFIMSPPIESFGDWVEQLVAESMGKEGKGILPVVGETLAGPSVYGPDRLFVHLRLKGDRSQDAAVAALEAAGHPVVRFKLTNLADLGYQFFLWEMATAAAGAVLAINPFDQPNVESAKVLGRKMVAAYQEKGQLPRVQPALTADGIEVYGKGRPSGLGPALDDFLADLQPGAYVTLQAYLKPDADTDKALLELRRKLRDRTRAAVTAGYGPRFLHSTGQLHKGDAGLGRFIQFTSDPDQDLPIPDRVGDPQSALSFGALVLAQAMGDGQALADAGRRVIRFHLGKGAKAGLKKMAALLK